jgi:hypothetical protein
MATGDCPIVVADGTLQFIETGYTTLMGYGSQAFGVTLNTFSQLLEFQPNFIPVNVVYQFDNTINAPTQIGPPPIDTATYHPPSDDPGLPPGARATQPQFDLNPPAASLSPPVLTPLPAGPSTLPQDPGPAPGLSDPSLPATQVIVFPDVPALIDVLPLPLLPNIQLPTFQGIRPQFNIQAPTINANFTPVQYTDALQGEVTNAISLMLQGDFNLPPGYEQALFDRAVAKEDSNALKVVQEVRDDFGTLGFSEPNGVLAKRLTMVRQGNQNARSQLNREVYIKAAESALENLRLSIDKGVALEAILLQNWIQWQTLLLDSQKFILQVAVESTNLKVSVYNASLQGYLADAQVYRDLIQGELAKLEIYKAELTAKQIIGQLNQQLVEIYQAQLLAVREKIDVYNAQLQGVLAVVAINKERIEAYIATVQAYGERIKAYEVQWEAVRIAATVQQTQEAIYDTSVKAFLGQMQAWATKNQALADIGKFGIAFDEHNLNIWRGKLEKFVEELKIAIAQYEADINFYSNKLKAYEAQGRVVETYDAAASRSFQLGMEREKNSKDIAIKNLELQINELLQGSAQVLEAKRSVASGAGSLAAAALSATSFAAHAQTSLDQSFGCTTSTNTTISFVGS